MTEMPRLNLKGQLDGSFEGRSVPWVWVPTQQVLLTSVTVPGKRAADWMQALPYMLEESLAQPIEQLHFAVLHREKSGAQAGLTHVAVVEKTLMQQWVDELKAHGLTQAALVPDCFQVPWTPNEASDSPDEQAWYFLPASEGDWVWVRTGRYDGLACDEAWMQQLYETRRAQRPGLQLVEVDATTPNEEKGSAFSLRQGAYQASSEANPVWQRWRWPVVTAVLIVLLMMGQSLSETARFQTQAEQTKAQTLALFKTLFPDVKRVVNIRAQTKTRLAGQTSGSSEQGPMARLADIEKWVLPMVQAKTLTLLEVQWRQNQWQMKVSAKQSQLLQDLADQLGKQGMKTEFKIERLAPDLAEGVIYVR